MGVTTVLSVISKPMLIQWAANMAVEYIRSNVIWSSDGINGNVSTVMLDKAKTAHRTKKEKAGDWGTIVHKSIEAWIKNGTIPNLEGTQLQAFNNFRQWAAQNNVEFLESEKHLHSKELWIGGICDLVIKMHGKKYIADIKTSSSIYNEHFFQMAAYALCLEEMGEKDIEGYLVINLKKDGSIDEKLALDMELNKQAFKAALTLHKIINSLT